MTLRWLRPGGDLIVGFGQSVSTTKRNLNKASQPRPSPPAAIPDLFKIAADISAKITAKQGRLPPCGLLAASFKKSDAAMSEERRPRFSDGPKRS
jgi:hypothetical protein